MEEAGADAKTDVRAGRSSTVLAEDEVHLWVVPIATAANWASALPREDVDRADRFRSTEDRRRFEASHASLHLLLSRYLGAAPGTVSMGREPDGKPYIAGDANLAFNISHSKTTTVIAIARNMRLGVDIEPLPVAADFDRIAGQFFSPSEATALSRLDQSRRGVAFLEAWTRKEAVAKACGVGVAKTLQTIRVPTGPMDGQPIVVGETQAQRETWYLYSLDDVPGHVGAIAASRRPRRIRPRVLS